MSVVRLRIAPDSANVRLVRLVVTSLCRMSDLPETAIDDIRLAAGEACGRAVSAQRSVGIDEPVTVEIVSDETVVTVSVSDRAPADLHKPDGDASDSVVHSLGDAIRLPQALEIINGLADDVDVVSSSAGSTIEMSWQVSGV